MRATAPNWPTLSAERDRGLSAGFVGTSSQGRSRRGNQRSERCCGSARIREVGADHRCGAGSRMAHSCSHVTRPVWGRCGGIPRRRGCAGDFSAGQGEGLPPYSVSCCPTPFPVASGTGSHDGGPGRLSCLVPPSYLTPQGCCRQICLRAHRTNPLHVGYSDIIYGPGLRKTQRPI